MRRLARHTYPLAHHHSARLWRRLHYLYRDEDPAGVELLSGALTLAFALILLWPQHISLTPHPPVVWGLVALSAGLLQIGGVIWERRSARIHGLLFGAGFWATFALAYGLSAATPNWVAYAVLSIASAWALRKVVSP